LFAAQSDGVLEIKNLAVAPAHQRKGYGRRMIAAMEERYQDRFFVLQVGTGESPLTLPFYEKCVFAVSHRIKNFFTEHYDHPIGEGGVRLVNMAYLRKI
jgi:GNAT superfamily N-acetyltransferase